MTARGHLGHAAAAGIAVAVAAVGLASGAGAATLDYLYVEANEGGSSGGHTAIGLGEQTFHFQNRNGLLVLDRDPTRDFLHGYALVNNRTIHASRVALAEADRERIRATFARRYHAQRRQLDVLEALREDRRLIEGWQRAAESGEPSGSSPEVPGLGYFAPGAEPDRDVSRLREAIESHYGEGFLAARREATLERLEQVASRNPAGWRVREPDHAYDDPPFSQPYARSYVDSAAGIAALLVLEGAWAPAAGTTVAPQGPRYWLTPAEIERTRSRQQELSEELVRLAGSERADWGRPFLVGLARLLAHNESVRRGRLVVVDVLPEDARRLEYRVLEPRLALIREILAAGHEQEEEARAGLLDPEAAGERPWTRLEDAVNRVFELETAVREERALRLARGALVPGRVGVLPIDLPRATREPWLERARSRTLAREESYEDRLESLYHYELISHNCVSELFHTMNHAFDDSIPEVRDALGGYVDGRRSLAFIPFISARAVDDHYRVVSRRVLPSWREMQIARMRENEGALRVALRESNTLTAESYHRGYSDSFFLFFTERPVVLRPIFGVFNLTAAIGESLWGLVRLPIDRGETLLSGLEGALVSLPELGFGNIRKGSNDWVAPRRQSLDD